MAAEPPLKAQAGWRRQDRPSEKAQPLPADTSRLPRLVSVRLVSQMVRSCRYQSNMLATADVTGRTPSEPVGRVVTCRLSTTRVTFGTARTISTAFALISGVSTCPASVTTPLVEFTEMFVTLETPISEASLDFTCAVILRSSTWASGDSLV